MCGIVGYISNNNIKVSVESLLKIVDFNKHRGSEDGIGIITKGKQGYQIRKTMNTMDEISKEEKSNETDYTKDLSKKEKETVLKKWKEELIKMKKTESNFCLIHHRKKSHGEKCKVNTHPFRIKKNVYYIHNGTLDSYSSLGRYISINDGIKLISKTDSEVLANIMESYLDSVGKKGVINSDVAEQLFNYLLEIFHEFGIIMRLDIENGFLDYISDGTRSFYIYELKGKENNVNCYLLTSEPYIGDSSDSLKNIEEVYKINSGWFRIYINKEKDNLLLKKEDCFFEKVRNKIKQISDILRNGKKYNIKIDEISCDSCSTKKQCIRHVYLKDEKGEEKKQDICMDCFINDSLKGTQRILCKNFKYDFSANKNETQNYENGTSSFFGNKCFQHNTKKEEKNIDDFVIGNEFMSEDCYHCLKFLTSDFACFSCPSFNELSKENQEKMRKIINEGREKIKQNNPIRDAYRMI